MSKFFSNFPISARFNLIHMSNVNCPEQEMDAKVALQLARKHSVLINKYITHWIWSISNFPFTDAEFEFVLICFKPDSSSASVNEKLEFF